MRTRRSTDRRRRRPRKHYKGTWAIGPDFRGLLLYVQLPRLGLSCLAFQLIKSTLLLILLSLLTSAILLISTLLSRLLSLLLFLRAYEH